MDVRPGMTVADISSGGGYTTELLARAVGPTGRVYAHNLKPRLEERMKKPAMKNVVEVVGPFENPFPPEVRNLDLVTFNFNYHDTTYMGVGSGQNEQRRVRRVEAGRTLHRRRSLRAARRRRRRGEIIAPHRRERGAQRSRGGRLQAGRRRGFLRNPGDPRTAPVTNPAQAERRIRAEVRETVAFNPGGNHATPDAEYRGHAGRAGAGRRLCNAAGAQCGQGWQHRNMVARPVGHARHDGKRQGHHDRPVDPRQSEDTASVQESRRARQAGPDTRHARAWRPSRRRGGAGEEEQCPDVGTGRP